MFLYDGCDLLLDVFVVVVVVRFVEECMVELVDD